jgi:hypothetical protein
MMDFNAALKLLKTFSACQPKIYKQFSGFPEASSQESESGYAVFVDASLAQKVCYCELKEFAETNNLSIKPYGNCLMVSSPTSNF